MLGGGGGPGRAHRGRSVGRGMAGCKGGACGGQGEGVGAPRSRCPVVVSGVGVTLPCPPQLSPSLAATGG